MKKHGIFLAIAMLASMAVFAQEGVLPLPKYKFGFGLKGGVNIANMRYTFDEFADYENSFLVKPQFGVFIDIPVAPQFSRSIPRAMWTTASTPSLSTYACRWSTRLNLVTCSPLI